MSSQYYAEKVHSDPLIWKQTVERESNHRFKSMNKGILYGLVSETNGISIDKRSLHNKMT